MVPYSMMSFGMEASLYTYEEFLDAVKKRKGSVWDKMCTVDLVYGGINLSGEYL